MEGRGKKRYCVTGSTGYIASSLINALLGSKNYYVHATTRDPARYSHPSKFLGANDRLRIFQADLLEEGSFDEAVKGCIGVFHVASINAVQCSRKGKYCTLTAKDTNGNWRPFVDESCQIPIDYVWNTKACGWVYALSKVSTENAAFQFAYDKGIDLVSVITTTVAGPFLTSTIPSSIQVLLSPITGDPQFFPILSAVSSRMGSVAVVHIEDICNAHIFLMDHGKAQARYICCTQSCVMSDLVRHLAKVYPCPNLQRLTTKDQCPSPTEISSKKLKDLGFTYKESYETWLTACR